MPNRWFELRRLQTYPPQMRWMVLLAVCVLAAVTAAAQAPAPTLVPPVAPLRSPLRRTPPDALGLSAPRLADATALLGQLVAEQKIAGAVAAVARDRTSVV